MKKKDLYTKLMLESPQGVEPEFLLKRWCPLVQKKTLLGWKFQEWEHIVITQNGVYLDGKLVAKGKLALVDPLPQGKKGEE